MIKINLDSTTKKFFSERALTALADGQGERALGTGSSGIGVGFTAKILGIDYRTEKMMPNGYSADEWSKLSEEEKAKEGVERSWFELNTSNGGVALNSLFTNLDSKEKDFWTSQEGDTQDRETEYCVLSEDWDSVKDNLWEPSVRSVRAWCENKCDGIIGKSLRCVAVKQYPKQRRDGSTYYVRVRAWVVE